MHNRNLPESIAHAIESGRIPSPPQLLLRLLHMVDGERSTISELSALVGQDAGLTSRLLTVANSPALRRGSHLTSLDACLVALGTRMVRSLATCLSIQNLFDRQTSVPAANLSAFWGHSLLVAEVARAVAVAARSAHPDEAYLAGLLHDVGELILLAALGEPYARLLASAEDEATLQLQEVAQFGVHHGEIATWLADRWELDSSFADGILFHHASRDDIVTAGELPQLVWLAHELASAEDVSALIAELPVEIIELTGKTDLVALRRQSEARTRMLGEAIGIRLPDPITKAMVWQDLPPPAVSGKQDDPDSELSAMIGGMALMQPLQQDLFTVENEAELLLSLRESARILFDLNHVAFLLLDNAGTKLSGAGVGAQPAIFRQVSLPSDTDKSLVAMSVRCQDIRASVNTPVSSLIDAQFARAFGTEGILSLPIISRGRSLGAIVCGLSNAHHARLVRRLPWLLNFGRIAAVSLETLREARALRDAAESAATDRFNRQARRVIHEARNPLGIIKSYLKILDQKLPAETGVRQELEILTEEIDRVASIVGRMSEIPKGDGVKSGIVPSDLLRELLMLYGDPLFQDKSIRVEASIPPNTPRIPCDRDSLKQILLNLWKNASEALSAGQVMKITLTDHVVHNGQAFVQIRMDDNGPGMSDEAMRAIYKPRENVGNASRGMGLSIVGELARRQGIAISCHSLPRKGTSIALLLPKQEAFEDVVTTNDPTRRVVVGEGG